MLLRHCRNNNRHVSSSIRRIARFQSTDASTEMTTQRFAKDAPTMSSTTSPILDPPSEDSPANSWARLPKSITSPVVDMDAKAPSRAQGTKHQGKDYVTKSTKIFFDPKPIPTMHDKILRPHAHMERETWWKPSHRDTIYQAEKKVYFKKLKELRIQYIKEQKEYAAVKDQAARDEFSKILAARPIKLAKRQAWAAIKKVRHEERQAAIAEEKNIKKATVWEPNRLRVEEKRMQEARNRMKFLVKEREEHWLKLDAKLTDNFFESRHEGITGFWVKHSSRDKENAYNFFTMSSKGDELNEDEEDELDLIDWKKIPENSARPEYNVN